MCVCPLPPYSILTFPLTQTPPYTGYPLPSTNASSLFTRSAECSLDLKKPFARKLKMCLHKSFLLECELRMAFIEVLYIEKSICLSSPQSWRHKYFHLHQQFQSFRGGVWMRGGGKYRGTCSSFQEEQERGAKKMILIVKVPWSASEPAPGRSCPYWAASSTAQSWVTRQRTR